MTLSDREYWLGVCVGIITGGGLALLTMIVYYAVTNTLVCPLL